MPVSSASSRTAAAWLVSCGVDVAAGKGPAALEGRPAAPDEQKVSVGGEDDGVSGIADGLGRGLGGQVGSLVVVVVEAGRPVRSSLAAEGGGARARQSVR